MTEFQKPLPLEIKCTNSDCDNDLHCFKRARKMKPEQVGTCRTCGADLVDWQRLHSRNLADVTHTFEALQHEWIRDHFFRKPIDDEAVRHAQRKGRDQLNEAARTRLEKSLGPAKPFRDGQQTGFKGNAIYYAQHATATCCRTCLEYWHGIPKGRDLSSGELDYCTKLVELFLELRLPELADEPIKVPRRRRQGPDVVE